MGARAQGPELSSASYPGHWQEAGLEVEQLAHAPTSSGMPAPQDALALANYLFKRSVLKS